MPQPTVVIDPGHGGAAPAGGSSPNNAVGPNGLLEKDLVLDIGRRVGELLGTRANVILTRTVDENRSLGERARIARDAKADVFVSLHLNGSPDRRVDGSEAWVARQAGAASRDLARSVLDRLLGVTHAEDRGVRSEDLGVILPRRHAASTAAALVELAFLTNPDEADRLARESYRQELAAAIADGVASRLPAHLPGMAQGLSFTPAPGAGSIFLAASVGTDYPDYVQPVTRGDAEPLINGRSSNPPIDRTEPLDSMQAFVQTTTAGDSVYLAAWYFEPRTPLTAGSYGVIKTWGGLLATKAAEGVKIRILQTDFDPITGGSRASVRTWMGVMDRWIDRLPAGAKDNLQYVVSMHPASFGALRSIWAGRTSINIGSHHQKFMVVKRGSETIAFCGGLDIESRKTPAAWSDAGLAGWHDIHVKLRGPIARDLEKEFALRWNREQGSTTVAPSPLPWSGYDTLPVPSPPVNSELDAEPERQQEDAQMVRTVSSGATFSPFTTDRDDVKQIYHNIVRATEVFLYFENQYFRSLDLADWIAAKAASNPSTIAIFVVVDVPEEGDDPVTQHGNHLQFEFFDRVLKAFGSRAAVYTMTQRAVHSKFLLVDDRYMTIGSANANERSFQLDSELNVAIDDVNLTTAFRRRLWAHNLGTSEATVATWNFPDFIAQWDAVASANAGLAPGAQLGEGIVRWDHTKQPGSSHAYVPDYLAEATPDWTGHLDADVQVANAGTDEDRGVAFA